MQIGQCLMLIHLGHTQFFNEELFDFFQLVYIFIYLWNLTMSLFYQHLIIVPLLIFNHSFTFNLHLNELTFSLINFISLSSSSIEIIFFVAYPFFKQSLLLSDHNSFHTHGSLLNLKFGMSNLLIMQSFSNSVALRNFCLFIFNLLIS